MTNKVWLKQYPQGVPAEIDPDTYHSLNEMFELSCEKFADKPALSNLGITLTYRELEEKSKQFAAYLQQVLGLKKGDRVAIMLPNILQYFVVVFGILRAGLIVVNVNPLYTPRELEYQLNDSQADAIIVLANFANTLQQALPAITRLKHVIITELGDLFPFFKAQIVNFVVKRIKKLVPSYQITNAVRFKDAMTKAKHLAFTRLEIGPEDVAFLQYTGGTTGMAKGAILTHRNLVANLLQAITWVGSNLREGQEIIVTPLPLYHIFSLTICALSFMKIGGMCILITNPRDISGFVKELSKLRYTAFVGINTLFNALLNNPDFVKLDFSQLKITVCGGMPLQKVVADRWQQVTKNCILEGYGLTETSPVVTINPPGINSYTGSIGMPIPSTDVTFRDDEGQDVPLGQDGELCVKGPQVMRGYWHNDDETRRVFTSDGWLKTGDIGHMDERGFVYLVDRKKDMILVSGFNVYPNEVESVLAAHHGILEVAVIGVPSPSTGEAVKAFIVKRDPKLTKEEVLTYCHKHLTGYKVPKYIEFKNELPKSNVGKILRRKLREEETAK